jgi:hypothetical protein
MRIWEIIARVDEMAFRRRAIVEKLRALQPQISSHALKIIAYPDSHDIAHWKRELGAWGNDLARMFLRTAMGKQRPMGFKMAWEHLYEEPFGGVERRVLPLHLGQIEHDYQRPIEKQPAEIMKELTAFLRLFCQRIGEGQLVHPFVDSWKPEPVPTTLPEPVQA